jgi:hypothetical protein
VLVLANGAGKVLEEDLLDFGYGYRVSGPPSGHHSTTQ